MKRYLALGGLMGPVIFTIIVVVCAGLRPDYSHVHSFISELGAKGTPNDQLMNFAGFMPTGFLLTLFGIYLFVSLRNRLISKVGSALMTVFGLGVIMAGIFSCDPGCPLGGSTEAVIHDRVSAIAFNSAILGVLLLGFSFGTPSEFRRLKFYSIISAVLAAIFLVAMISTFETRNFTGIWQRFLLLTIFAWTSVAGIHTFKKCQSS